ncbi:HepT-like ribonuclease domain-containing protein [Hydrogenimonas sp.]
MSEKIRFNLMALLESIDKIRRYSADAADADDFHHDEKSFDATMMQFVVMGEAIARIDEDFKAKHQQIPWQLVKDFRNIIAHDCFGIDAEEVWDILQNHLDPHEREVRGLLQHFGESS